MFQMDGNAQPAQGQSDRKQRLPGYFQIAPV
jgi:hypothetical protein